MPARNALPWDELIELFAGAGGFTWGWCRAGFTVRAAIDSDTAAARTHELNFGHGQCLSLNRDLTTFPPDALQRLLGGRPPRLLAVVGGPPCQGWSKAGRGKLRSLHDRARSLLEDPRNSLYRQFVRYVDHFQPPVYVMENVPGMLNLEGRNVADELSVNFLDIGYRTTYAVVNARDFGVPQDRRRLIFIGVRSDLDLPLDAKELARFGSQFRRRFLGLSGETTVRHGIGDLPRVPHGEREDPQPYKRPPGRLPRYAELMRAGSNGLITDHVCREHNEQDLEAFSIMPEGGIYADLPRRLKRYRDDIFRDKYRRLRWDRPAGTITAHLAKDCYTHIHPDQPRTITIREAARLQSFPDNFRFYGNMGDRFRQIGNAVPPLLAWGIAAYIRQVLETSMNMS